jgi:hypothetical protein
MLEIYVLVMLYTRVRKGSDLSHRLLHTSCSSPKRKIQVFALYGPRIVRSVSNIEDKISWSFRVNIDVKISWSFRVNIGVKMQVKLSLKLLSDKDFENLGKC